MQAMPNIRSIDMMLLNDLFEVNGGYALNFSDNTFSRFFAEELQSDIDAPVYRQNGIFASSISFLHDARRKNGDTVDLFACN